MKRCLVALVSFGVLFTASASVYLYLTNLPAYAASEFPTTPLQDSNLTIGSVPIDKVSYSGDSAHFSADPDQNYASKLDQYAFTLRTQVENNFNLEDTNKELSHCKSLIYRTLQSLPKAHVGKLKNLTLIFSENARRGLGGGTSVYLRCENISDSELVAVMVHEIGHITDSTVLTGNIIAGTSAFLDGNNPVYNNDSSLNFYQISFENEKTIRYAGLEADFVSGYAMTDPFEDFAETYAFYLLHGNEFRAMAQNNPALSQKYFFMKYSVFAGKEYLNGDLKNTASRNFDVTVLSYDLGKFFAV